MDFYHRPERTRARNQDGGDPARARRRQGAPAGSLLERGRKSLQAYLEQNVWPLIPPEELGRAMGREEEDKILGYGPEGF